MAHRLHRTRPVRRAGLTFLVAGALVAGQAAMAAATDGSVTGTCDSNFVPADTPNLQTMMAACPVGTSYTFAAGTYRVTGSLLPRTGDTITGAGSGPGGTRFTGSSVITGWTKSGSLWIHTGDAVKVGVMVDPCADGTKACDYQDWLYMDGTWMARKLSPCSVLTATQYCIDYTANKIYIAISPTGHLFEYGTDLQLFGSRYHDVTVQSFAYDDFTAPGGGMSVGQGWLVKDVSGSHNHSCGIVASPTILSNSAVIEDSTFNHNGYHGWCSPSLGVQILNSDFSYNNELGFSHGSGLNLHGENSALVQGNTASYNAGPGIDIGTTTSGATASINIDVIGNTVSYNAGAGIRFDGVCKTAVQSNIVIGNTDFGIEIYDSNNNTVSNNTVVTPSTDGGGIRIRADNATGSNNCGAGNDARNNVVSGNDVTMNTVADPGPFGNINGIVNQGGLTGGNSFVGNDYHVPGGNCSVPNWQIWTGYVQMQNPFVDWQGRNQDIAPGGTCRA